MNKKLYQYSLILLGIILIIAFIWFRFIRTRLPKDIPLNLSLLGFVLLVSTCSIFLYIVISLIKQRKSTLFIKQLMSIVYMPLQALDHFIKNHSYLNKLYKQSIIYLMQKLTFIIINNNIYYYLCEIAPRLLLLSVLFYDTFYLQKLANIYKFLLIGIIILVGKYVIYSLKYAKETFIESIEPYVIIRMAYEYASQIVDDNDEEDDDIPETMVVPLKDFLIFQIGVFLDQEKFYPYTVSCAQYNITDYKQQGILVPINKKYTQEKINTRIDNLLKISILLFYYDYTSQNNEEIKKLKILIYLNYFFCWFYILIVSLPSLYYASFWELWIIFSIQDIEEPFSQLNIFSYEARK